MIVNNFDKKELPVSFRIIGIGENSKNIINQINAEGYPDVKVIQLANETLFPEEEDKMVILINPSNKEIQSLSKSFYQAGVLTLIVSTENRYYETDCFDSYTLVSEENVLPTIKDLFYPIFHYGPIAYDFYDFSSTLKESGRFIVKTFESHSSINRVDDIIRKLNKEFVSFEGIDNFTFIISYNRNSESILQLDEIKPFQTFLTSLPVNVDIIWGVQFDESMDMNTLKVSILASGKNLKL